MSEPFTRWTELNEWKERAEQAERALAGAKLRLIDHELLIEERDTARRALAEWKDMGDKEHALAVQFATEADQLRAALACTICGGIALISGRPCICKGTNKIHVEVQELLVALAEKEQELESVRRQRDLSFRQWKSDEEQRTYWDHVLGLHRKRAEDAESALAEAHATLRALQVYPSRNCWGRYGCTDDQHDDLCLKARATLTPPASGAQR